MALTEMCFFGRSFNEKVLLAERVVVPSNQVYFSGPCAPLMAAWMVMESLLKKANLKVPINREG